MNKLFFEDLKLIQKDPNQRAAYESNVSTVVIAGPGSGKTKVLALKAITLSETQISKPAGLACISFSRETVRELKKRLKMYGYKTNDRDFIGTIHTFSLQHVIRPFAHLFPKYQVKYPLKIITDEISNSIYERVLKTLDVDSKEVSYNDINKQRCLSLEGISTIKIKTSPLIKEAARIYEEKLILTGYLDFTSIINISALIIREQEFVRKSLQSRFPWLLIDEYQDLGKALHEMVLELFFNAEVKIYAVGDTNQSIYGFNGGYPDFLKELTIFSDDIKPIYLEANYRSSQHIITASLEALMLLPPIPKYTAQKRANENEDFTFITCDEEMDQQYEVVAKKVIPKLINNGIALNEIGIITASNNEVISMARSLSINQIPFYIAKWDFKSSNLIIWLQECANWCIKKENQSFDDLFRFWKRLLFEHDDGRKNFENIKLKVIFHQILIRSESKENIEQWLTYIIYGFQILDTLKDSKRYPDEIDNINKLLNQARIGSLKDTKLERFAQLGFPKNEITITTRHSSKGLEFEVVIMLGMEEEKFPSYYHLQDELLIAEDQRLCYVCISRAKKSCILLRSKTYTFNTKKGLWVKPFAPSRFWNILFKKFGNQQNNFTHKNY